MHLSTSSLAAEQLMISAAEWLLFLLVVATNGLNSGPNIQEVRAPTTPAGPPVLIATASAEEDAAAVARTNEAVGIAEPAINSTKSYGSLTDSITARTPVAVMESAPAETAQQGHTPHEPSLTNTSNESADMDAAEPLTSSDIVDMPKDRRTSMADARERLFRARENGKVRRRSLWKKFRGKGKDGEESESQSIAR
ncbi:hypothetical protein CBS101457_003896 [Exobasidium rhododendri]|nr:hypothetical protein CBS101457_003896 [Exobasidium rhododendri]